MRISKSSKDAVWQVCLRWWMSCLKHSYLRTYFCLNVQGISLYTLPPVLFPLCAVHYFYPRLTGNSPMIIYSVIICNLDLHPSYLPFIYTFIYSKEALIYNKHFVKIFWDNNDNKSMALIFITIGKNITKMTLFRLDWCHQLTSTRSFSDERFKEASFVVSLPL